MTVQAEGTSVQSGVCVGAGDWRPLGSAGVDSSLRTHLKDFMSNRSLL